MVASNNIKTPDCHNCGSVGLISRNCYKSKRKCYSCQRYGHISKFCRKPINNNTTNGLQNTQQSLNHYNKNTTNSNDINRNIQWRDINLLKSFLVPTPTPIMFTPNQMNFIPQSQALISSQPQIVH